MAAYKNEISSTTNTGGCKIKTMEIAKRHCHTAVFFYSIVTVADHWFRQFRMVNFIN